MSFKVYGWRDGQVIVPATWAAKIKAREIVQIAHLNTKEAKEAKSTQQNSASFSLNSLFF